jgi:intraflagellar transport protein 57
VREQAKQHLERMQVDITGGLDKLQAREKYLNEQFEQLMRQYRFIREQLLGVQVQCSAWGAM